MQEPNTPPDPESEISQAAASDLTASTPLEESGDPFLPTEGNASPATVFYRPPRLGISHLLAWITMAAIAMKIMLSYERGAEWADQSPSRYHIVWQIIVYTAVPIDAAGLVGAFVTLRDKLWGAVGRLQPGHWFVVLFSLSWLFHLGLVLGAVLLSQLVPYLADNSTQRVLTLTYGVLEAILSLVFLVLLIMSRVRWHWRIVFASLTGFTASAAGMSIIFYLMSKADDSTVWFYYIELGNGVHLVFCLLAGFATVLAVIVDLACRNRRGGLHWLGVAIVALACLQTAIWWIASKIM